MAITVSEFSLKKALDQLKSEVDIQSRVNADPVRFPRRFDDPQDQEVVSLFAALLAYGRVSAIGIAVEDVLMRIGSHPAEVAQKDAQSWVESGNLPTRFDGFIYRFTRGADLTKLWIGIGVVLTEYGSLGTVMRAGLKENASDLIEAYQFLYDHLIRASDGFPALRVFNHLLSDPRRGSALKRINMWLRWLVRGPDEVDLGIWSDLDPARLLLPLDVHTFRLSSALGLTTRRSADLKTAREVTQQLKSLSLSDPISYDFALAHLGISRACHGHRVKEICVQCPLNALCTL